jgi:hypothetical protein
VPSGAEVIAAQVRYVICAKASNAAAVNAGHVISAKATDVIATKAPHVTAVEAADVTSAKTTTNMAAAKASHATTMSSASTAATARLCTGGNKAAGKYCACQNHHHSSSHDILHLRWADIPPQVQLDVSLSQQRRTNVAMNCRWECLCSVATKFVFSGLNIRISVKPDTSGRGFGSEARHKMQENAQLPRSAAKHLRIGSRNYSSLQMRQDFSRLKKGRTAHPPHSGGTRRIVRRPLNSHMIGGPCAAVLDVIWAHEVILCH